MSEFNVDISTTSAWVNFAPGTLLEEVQQNIKTIVTTVLGTAPGSRNIGVEVELVDEPIHITQARITGIIRTAIADIEPRAQVTRITFDHQNIETGMYGTLLPVIWFILADQGDA